MDGKVHIAKLAAPVKLGFTVPFFGQRKAEHITVELRYPLGLAGHEDHSGDESDVLGSLGRAVRHETPPCRGSFQAAASKIVQILRDPGNTVDGSLPAAELVTGRTGRTDRIEAHQPGTEERIRWTCPSNSPLLSTRPVQPFPSGSCPPRSSG
jgi:hypothetical protein